MLKDNLIEVEEHIKKACEKSGRNPEDVCLVAVSKIGRASCRERV